MGADTGEIGLLKKSMFGTRDATSNLKVLLARAHQKLGILAGTQLKKYVLSKKKITEFQERRMVTTSC